MLKKTTFIEQSFYDELTAEEQRDALKIAEHWWQDFGSRIKSVASAFYCNNTKREIHTYVHGDGFFVMVPSQEAEKLIVFPLEYVEDLRTLDDTFLYSITVRMLLGENRVHWYYPLSYPRRPFGEGIRATLPNPQLEIFVFEPIQEQAED
jgi:hypothetical protein